MIHTGKDGYHLCDDEHDIICNKPNYKILQRFCKT